MRNKKYFNRSWNDRPFYTRKINDKAKFQLGEKIWNHIRRR